MGEENFIIWLNERTYVAVDFATFRGRVVTFVVRLMRTDPAGDRVLSRFDTAHGLPHHDLLTDLPVSSERDFAGIRGFISEEKHGRGEVA
jgi:hypothetical protein